MKFHDMNPTGSLTGTVKYLCVLNHLISQETHEYRLSAPFYWTLIEESQPQAHYASLGCHDAAWFVA